VLGVDPTTGRGAGRRDTEDIERLVEELVNERIVEAYNKLREDMDKRFAALEEHFDERTIRSLRSLVKAMVDSEAAKMHNIVMEEIARVEEKLKKHGIDAELVKQIVNEIQSRLLNDIKQLLDQRIAHIISVIDEQGNEVRDALDLINEILRSEIEFGEKIEEVRRLLDEERLEELLYRVLVKRGLIRKRRRRWGWVAVGLGILIAIVTGFLINPILTAVVLFIVFVVLMRW